MRISCEACGSSYNVSDDKVRGRRVKVRCKNCRTAIVVDGVALAADEAAAAIGDDGDDDVATRVADPSAGFGAFRAPPPPAQPALQMPATAVWSVDFGENDQRNMSAGEIARAYRAGQITEEHHVWADGMADWTPVLDVAELRRAIEALRPSRPAGPQPRPASAPPPRAPAAPAAPVAMARARRSAPAARAGGRGRGPVDLFGNVEHAGSEDEVVSSAGAAPAQHALPAQHAVEAAPTGQRNESSVLFSLSSLKASLGSAPSAAPKRSSPAASAVDDLIGLGGSASPLFSLQANQALLSAPVVEPPPPARPAPETDLGSVMPSAAVPEPKRRAPLLVGIALGSLLLVGGGITAALTLSGKGDARAASSGEAKPTTASDTPGDSKHESKPAAAADEAKPEAAAKPGEPAAEAKAPDDAKGASPEEKKKLLAAWQKAKEAEKADDAKPPDKPDKKKKATDETEEKSDQPAAPAPPFSKAAAMSALNSAAGAAAGCKKPGGPTGRGRAEVTFAPSGRVTSATVSGGSFGGTSVGGCIASAFRRARVPAFSGGSVTVGKSFTVPD